MDRRTKMKAITSVFCLLISLVALYTFIFVAEVSFFWRVILIVIGVFWVISAVTNLKVSFRR